MKVFGLIGFPLSHSFSKRYFTDKFESANIATCQYELFPIERAHELSDLLQKNPSIRGLNVTIPHKVAVIPLLDEVDEAAAQIGAVNCIAVETRSGKRSLKGYNTDAYGFAESLKPLLTPHHRQALILGNGGAAKAVKYVLESLDIPYRVVSRKPEPGNLHYDELNESLLQTHPLIINTSPLGMAPAIDTYPPIPYEYLTDQHLAYDLVYNPEQTAFLKKAADRGAQTKNGLEMLYLQAERSWEIWNR